MKKSLIAIAIIAIGLTLGGCGANKSSADQADIERPNPSVAESDINGLQAVRLINSDEMVYIEDITAEEAATIDLVFRYYEATNGAETTDGELAWIYNPIRPAITDWFDPEFNLIENFKTLKQTDETGDMKTGTFAWIINPLSTELASQNADNVFYYRADQDLGGYVMSGGYFYLGYTYSSICQDQN